MVGPPPVASSVARARTSSGSPVRMSSMQHAGEPGAVGRRNEIERAVILQPPHVAPPDLLGQAVDDLDAGEIALVHGAVEGLPGERLLVHGAVGIAVEEAADLVLQLADAHRARSSTSSHASS